MGFSHTWTCARGVDGGWWVEVGALLALRAHARPVRPLHVGKPRQDGVFRTCRCSRGRRRLARPRALTRPLRWRTTAETAFVPLPSAHSTLRATT